MNRGKSTMQYALSTAERRDISLQENQTSTPFQSHQSIGQALGPPPHTVNVPSGSYRPPPPEGYRAPPTPQSPPTHSASASSSHGHSAPPPVPFGSATGPPPTNPNKRKPPESLINGALSKRRREQEPADDEDSGGGAKHWTDEEKTLLFRWLMGPTNDDHWNSLRATKNACLRECAVDAFGSKKTYQALKGCYERNFNLFKQIYAFESYHNQAGTGSMAGYGEADRLREYERRLSTARRAGCDVGNMTARTIDQWHRAGWYELFYRRWHGDPATMKPVPPRAGGTSGNTSTIPDDPEPDDDQTLDYSGSPQTSHHTITSHPPPPPPPHYNSLPSYISPHQTLRDAPPPPPPPILARAPSPPPTQPPPPLQTPISPPIIPAAAATDQTIVNLPITQGMISAYLQFLQVQTQTGKQKLEYLRRREEREEKESLQRREVERLRLDREKAEFEHNKQSANQKQRADRALELLGSSVVDASIKQAAGDYLKRLFMD